MFSDTYKELLFVYGYSSHDISIFIRYKLFDICILALYTFISP